MAEFIVADHASACGKALARDQAKAELRENAFGRTVTFLDFGGDAVEPQTAEGEIDEAVGGLPGEATPPIRAGQIEGQTRGMRDIGRTKSAAADELVLGFEDSRPKPIRVGGLAEIFRTKSVNGPLDRPRRPADKAAHFGIGVHRDEARFVLRFMGPETQPGGLQEKHVNKL